MRYVTAFCLFILFNGHRTEAQVFILFNGHRTEAQVLPTSSGSCAISASGAEDCDVMSAITLRRKTDTRKAIGRSHDQRSKVFVTRFTLAPGAPLNPLIEGREVLIVGINSGEVVK